MDSHCAVCGAYVPEGRAICPLCEKGEKMYKLKPCPFCGGKAKYIYSMPYNAVKCTKCGTFGKTIVDSYEQQDGKKDAIKAWNRRTANTPCDLCRFNPPSSMDGKPCTMCVADGRAEDGR